MAATARVDTRSTVSLPVALVMAQAAASAGVKASWHMERLWAIAAMSPAIAREVRLTRQMPVTMSDFAEAGPPRGGFWRGGFERSGGGARGGAMGDCL